MTRKVLAIACSLIFSVGSVAHADYLTDRLNGINEAQRKTNSEKSFQNKKIDPPSFGKWNGDSNKLVCESGKCVDPQYEEIKTEKAPRKANANFYGSMTGFEAGMNSQVHVDATVDKYLKGKLTLAYITMGLTEPAVAAGLAQAVNYIGNDVNNRLQSEQVFFEQLKYIPDVSESLGQAYISCIANQQTVKKKNWMAAQAYCTGDTAKLVGEKDKFADDSNGMIGMNFSDDPSFDTGDGLTINLSDYIFQQEIDGGSAGNIQDFKTSFKDLVGDIKYEFERQQDAEHGGARTLKYSRTPPNNLFEDRLKQEAMMVHGKLLEAFTEACKYTPPDNPANAFQGDMFLAKKDIWAPYLVFPGFAPDSTIMRMLYDLAPNLKDAGCDYKAVYKWENVVYNNSTAPDAARDYVFLSNRIAFGRVYGIFIIAAEYLRKLNVGAFDTFARDAGFQLIYDVAGTRNFQAMFDQNARLFQEYMTYLGSRTAMNKQHNNQKGIKSGGNGGDGQAITSGPGGGATGND